MGNGYVVPGLTWEHVTPESAGYSSARPGGPARLVKDAPYHLDDGGVCNSASFVWLQPDDEVLPIGFIPYCHDLHTFPEPQAGRPKAEPLPNARTDLQHLPKILEVLPSSIFQTMQAPFYLSQRNVDHFNRIPRQIVAPVF
jgi:hypothetical protein